MKANARFSTVDGTHPRAEMVAFDGEERTYLGWNTRLRLGLGESFALGFLFAFLRAMEQMCLSQNLTILVRVRVPNG